MSNPTYVSAGFRRDLKNEFPYMELKWDEHRERWALWEIDSRGFRWLDQWIEGPAGEMMEPGDWLITRLRAAKKENQGILSVADRKTWIKALAKDADPWSCDDCSFACEDPRRFPASSVVHIDDKHRRWCISCLQKAGWKPGDLALNFGLVGVMRKASDKKNSARRSELRSIANHTIARDILVPMKPTVISPTRSDNG